MEDKKICQCLRRSKEPNPDSIADVPRSRRETGEGGRRPFMELLLKLTAAAGEES